MTNLLREVQPTVSDLSLDDQAITIPFADLPATCFVNPKDRPLGRLITLPMLANRNYKGLKIGKILTGDFITEATNQIRIMTKNPIGLTVLLGEIKNKVEIADNVSGNYHLALWRNTQVIIGKDTTANLLNIEARRSIISIGQDCMISEAWIQATDMHGVWDLETKKPVNKAGYSITIEDGVWIGRRSSIVRPVTVGKGAIIAFGAIVTKDVPRCSIVAGNPAQITKRNVTWTRHFKDQNEFERKVSSMNLDEDLITLIPTQANWSDKFAASVQNLKRLFLKESNPHG